MTRMPETKILRSGFPRWRVRAGPSHALDDTLQGVNRLISDAKLKQGAFPQMKFGVIVFPGSNCDHDAYNVVSEVAKQPCSMIWHESENLENSDAIIVPGGFAYG